MRTLKAVLLILPLGAVASWGQQAPAATSQAKVDRAEAYYRYSLANLLLNEAVANSRNAAQYVNEAIDDYKLAMKADPTTPAIAEELSDLYIQTGRSREAQTESTDAIAKDPNDVGAHRILARIYTSQITSSRNGVDQAMLGRAIGEYEKITELAPTDVHAWTLLGMLDRASQKQDDAEKAYKKALELDPENEDALTGMAGIAADKGDDAEAANLLRKAAEKNPSAESLKRLATTYEQMRKYSEAAETLQQALELNPEDAPDVARAMAKDLINAERYDDALQVYQDLADDDPTDGDAYLHMSQIYRDKGDYAKAREAGQKALAIDPDNIDFQYNPVTILQAEGKNLEAVRVMKDLLSSTAKKTYTPDDTQKRIDLLERSAVMQRLADQPEDAVTSYREIATLNPPVGATVAAYIIETYIGGKLYAKAEEEADADLKKFPNDRNLKVVRASLMAEMGKSDAAAADVKKLLDGKNDREIELALADIYQKGKKYDETAKALDAAEKLSMDTDEKMDVWFQRGAMFERMKNVPSAESEFRKILAQDPDHAATLNYLGYMLADRNTRLDEALTMISSAVKKEPGNGAYLDSLGWVYFKLNRLPEAEDNMRKAVVATPHDPTMHDHFAEVLMKESKVPDAIAQWEISLKEWDSSSPADMDASEVAKVRQKLANARSTLAKQNNR